jgi:hypothetical protein
MANMGIFGNIWVRSHHYAKKGDQHRGHYHHFDHVTLVATGGVLCNVEGETPKEFWAPTFIVIAKDKKHQFTALADDTTYFCVYAVRDKDGQVTDAYSDANSPYSSGPSTPEQVEAAMAPTCIECGGCEIADQLRQRG